LFCTTMQFATTSLESIRTPPNSSRTSTAGNLSHLNKNYSKLFRQGYEGRKRYVLASTTDTTVGYGRIYLPNADVNVTVSFGFSVWVFMLRACYSLVHLR
jgi:hypothetical protein